jgi:hypothetical protein
MMRRTVFRWTLVAVITLIALTLGLRQYVLHDLRSMPADSGLARAEAQVSGSRNKVLSSRAATDPGRVGIAASAERLRALYAQPDIGAATLVAAQSDDAVLWVQSIEMWSLCISSRFARPISEAEILKAESGTTQPNLAQTMREMNEWRDFPPLRLAIPEPYGSMVNNAVAKGLSALDPALETAMLNVSWAPLSAADNAAYQRVLSENRRWCESFPKDFFDRRRATGIGFVAQGATGALLHNTKAGWSSKRFDELEPKDFELVERIIRERQPDGLAQLLSQGNAFSSLNLVGDSHTLNWSAMTAAFAANGMVATLSSCELGVNDCSANSPRFKELCVSFGGCHLESVSEQIRYVLARDGFDPQWLDRETERVVRAIREGNLDALGIRRKRDDK